MLILFISLLCVSLIGGISSFQCAVQTPVYQESLYVGPVAIGWAGLKGRGLFLTADVKAGEVLLREKAFCHAFKSDVFESLDVLVLQLNELCASSYEQNYRLSYLCDGIRPIILPKLDDLRMPVEEDVPVAPRLSIEEIQGIVRYNSFDFFNSTDSKVKISEDKEVGSVLWLVTSFLNHCSRPTTYRRQAGEYMIITASGNLKKGDELTTMYHSSDDALRQWGIIK